MGRAQLPEGCGEELCGGHGSSGSSRRRRRGSRGCPRLAVLAAAAAPGSPRAAPCPQRGPPCHSGAELLLWVSGRCNAFSKKHFLKILKKKKKLNIFFNTFSLIPFVIIFNTSLFIVQTVLTPIPSPSIFYLSFLFFFPFFLFLNFF